MSWALRTCWNQDTGFQGEEAEQDMLKFASASDPFFDLRPVLLLPGGAVTFGTRDSDCVHIASRGSEACIIGGGF